MMMGPDCNSVESFKGNCPGVLTWVRHFIKSHISSPVRKD
jgi:hypothetical protein